MRTTGKKTKRRIILDVKESGVSRKTRQTHRVILPRAGDAIRDGLLSCDVLLEAGEDGTPPFEYLVLDFVDAFWNIPLTFQERRFFVGKGDGEFLVYLRAAQGSRNRPLSWAGVASLLIRCTQSLFSGPARASGGRPGPRIQLYVDDPCVALRGTKAQRDRAAAIIVVVWSLAGFPLAFRKAQRGSSITWIGCAIGAESDHIAASIAQEKVEELRDLTLEHLRGNIISLVALRSYIGLVNHFATLLFVWRPFLGELWAALYEGDKGHWYGAPKNCVWSKQVHSAMRWILAFLSKWSGSIVVRFRRDAFWNKGRNIRIVGDASPWGLGAYLLIDGVILEYYAVEITTALAEFLGTQIGSHRGQQTWEALNLVVALRTWKVHWRAERVSLEIRADSIAALTLVASLRAKGWALSAIAREYIRHGPRRRSLQARHLPPHAGCCIADCRRPIPEISARKSVATPQRPGICPVCVSAHARRHIFLRQRPPCGTQSG